MTPPDYAWTPAHEYEDPPEFYHRCCSCGWIFPPEHIHEHLSGKSEEEAEIELVCTQCYSADLSELRERIR